MKRFIYYTLCVFILWGSGTAKGQQANRIAQQLQEKKNQRSESVIPDFELFDEIKQPALTARSASLVAKSTLVNLKSNVVARIQRLEPELMELDIPYDGSTLTIELFNESPLRDDFIVRTSDGQVYQSNGTHYRGILKDDVQSIASISVFEEEIIGIVSSEKYGNIVIGKWSEAQGAHVVYSDRDLKIKNDYECQVKEVPDGPHPQHEAVQKDPSRSAAECVSIYFETDFALYENKGSVGAVENFVSGVFNNVSTLYANENINVEISEIFVWVSQDPYPTNSSSAALDEFMSQRPNFNGTLGHLMVIGGQNTGGIAYLNVLCSSSYNYGYSDVSSGYSNFPTYSWTVNVVTHETGHNMGSPHTHACSWGPQGNEALDDCYSSEGSCDPGPTPSNGGTIMSYCHLSGTGINFNKGFGSEPGDLIRSRVASASCLQQCGSGGGGGGCNLTITNVVEENASCSENNGKLTVQISGASGTVTYDIGNGPQSSNVFNNVAPGSYTVIVKNGSSCVRETSANIIMESEAPDLGATVTNATCGQPDGVIELDASGGDTPYTYKVGSQTQSNPIFDEMSSGNYTARVTDQNGCSETKQVTVFDSEGPILTSDITNTSCGEDNGTIDLTATGGATPYNYKLGNQNSSNGLFLDLAAGNYLVEVVDQNGCIDEANLTVQGSNAISADASVDHTRCGEANGEIQVDADGGTGTLRYSIGGNFQTSPDFTGVEAGTYTVRVRDAVNCEVNFDKAINSSESFTPAADVQHTTCDDDNGMIEVVVAGSTGPYEYRLGNSPYTSDNQFEGLGANIYALAVKDAQGCVVTAQAIVEPSSLPSPELQVDRTHCGVDNGSIDVQIKGGVGPYKYDIGAGFVDSARFENLKPATYLVVVQDAMGCVDSAQATIDSSEQVQALVAIEPTTCGDSNGIITLDAQAGIGPFAFSVGTGMSTENVFHNVPAGMHQVIVQDADDCVFTDSVWVDPSNAIVLDPIVDMTSCGLQNGRIQINASGGTGGLVYTIADSFGLQDEFSLLPPGSYTIQVKDAEECLEERLVEVLPSTNPVLDATIDDTHCGVDNGEIVMKASFGEGPYTYYLDGVVVDSNVVSALSAASYQLMVKDIHECMDSTQAVINPSTAPELSYQTLAASCYQQNGVISIVGASGIAPYQYSIGNAFSNDSVFNQVDSGTYQIMLRDSDNCIDSAVIEVAYDDQFKKPELDDQGAVCSEDAAILDIGLEGAPEISWTRNGAQLPETNTVLSTMDAGLYKVVVTYHEGCVLTDSTQIVVHEKPEQPLADQATICLGEQFVIAQTNPSYTYQWSNDSTGHEIAFGSSGRYQLKVLNEYGCFINKEIAMEVIQPVELTVLNDQLQLCEGESMELRVAGADSYQWYSEDASLSSTIVSNPVVSPSADASYLVIGTNQCFEDTLEFSVGIIEDMTIVTSDTLVIEGSPLALEAVGALEASWASEQEIDCADCVIALIRPEEPEEVHVLYTDGNGCSREAYVNIDITPLQDIFPRLINVITPNHDGMNDVLEFRGIETFRQTKLEVFNQQGLRIYEDKDYQNNWEGTFQGKVLPEGVYFYMISLLLDDRVFHFDSDLTIVRD